MKGDTKFSLVKHAIPSVHDCLPDVNTLLQFIATTRSCYIEYKTHNFGINRHINLGFTLQSIVSRRDNSILDGIMNEVLERIGCAKVDKSVAC